MARPNSIVCSLSSEGRPGKERRCKPACLGAGGIEILLWTVRGASILLLTEEVDHAPLQIFLALLIMSKNHTVHRITYIWPDFEMILAVSLFTEFYF